MAFHHIEHGPKNKITEYSFRYEKIAQGCGREAEPQYIKIWTHKCKITHKPKSNWARFNADSTLS